MNEPVTLTDKQAEALHQADIEIQKIVKELIFEDKIMIYAITMLFNKELYNLYRTGEQMQKKE